MFILVFIHTYRNTFIFIMRFGRFTKTLIGCIIVNLIHFCFNSERNDHKDLHFQKLLTSSFTKQNNHFLSILINVGLFNDVFNLLIALVLFRFMFDISFNYLHETIFYFYHRNQKMYYKLTHNIIINILTTITLY